MFLKSVRLREFNPLIEQLYGQLFRHQMNRDWKEADRVQGFIRKAEERESQMEQNQEGLRD